MADAAIVSRTVLAAPKDYTLGANEELLLKSVRALVDGTAAAGSFYPALQLVAPDGTVMWTATPDSSLAAGASADVTWFPGVKRPAASSSLSVTDGVTTVASTSTLDFTSGATVSSGGAGIADVAITGGGGGLNLLYESTLANAAAAFDTGTNGIAQGHKDLVCYLIAKSASAANSDGLQMQFNGDTAGDYAWALMRELVGTVSGTAAAALVTSMSIGQCPAANFGTLQDPGTTRIDIPGYDLGTLQKSAMSQSSFWGTVGGTANHEVWVGHNLWVSTVPVNRIRIFLSSGANFIAGSRLVIYGVH